MPKLPRVSGRQAIKALASAGFAVVRQKGSHAVLQKPLPGTTCTVVVPLHPDLAIGTLRGILRKAGVTPDEFAALLHA